jgi:hypothetical protein
MPQWNAAREQPFCYPPVFRRFRLAFDLIELSYMRGCDVLQRRSCANKLSGAEAARQLHCIASRLAERE